MSNKPKDEALEAPQDWMWEVMEDGDPQGWAEDNLRKIDADKAIKEYLKEND